MDREELRAIQTPLKERYREEPDTAVVTLSASGQLGEGVSCSVETGRAIAEATSLGIAVESGTVRAEGDLDFRGTLAVDRDAPVGFREIRLDFELDAEASEEELETLLKLTERYCVVFQTLAGSPQLSTSVSAT